MSQYKENDLRNMLEDVVNELELSGEQIQKHGQLGTPPAELVRLVLLEKNLKISALKKGLKGIASAYVDGVEQGMREEAENAYHDQDIPEAPDSYYILKAAIEHFGHETQINKIQEEALELALILNQRKCPTKDEKEMDEALYSELADMEIMMQQAKMLFDSQRIKRIVKTKLQRLYDNYLS